MVTARVRPRTDADVPACAALLRRVHATDGYPVEGVADAVAWLHPPGLLAAWVADRAGHVVGHVAVCAPGQGDAAASLLMDRLRIPKQMIAILARLFVDPGQRGEGLGQALATAALSYATDTGLSAVFDVMEKDQRAIRMYERLGCVLLGTTSHGVPDGGSVPALCYAAPGVLPDQPRPSG